MVKGKNIVVGLTGGIACYKACDLISKLRQKGADVNVVMTTSALEFVTPLTLKSLSGNDVHTDLFNSSEAVPHIELAEKADLVCIAPATANIISKMAHGIADDLLSTILLAANSPVLLAPAMNVHMYQNPIFQENLEKLKKMGIKTVGPNSGNLACGTSGKGRMAETKEILEAIEATLLSTRKDLSNKKILITAGGTREPLDPVRFIGNRSSGKMGYALANAASKRGAKVTLVTTTVREKDPEIDTVIVETADEMFKEVTLRSEKQDIIIMAAAVADFKPKSFSDNKIKKSEKDSLVLELIKTPDVLQYLGRNKKDTQILIGFAAETTDLKENALKKLKSKNVDLIAANNVSLKESTFGSSTNLVTIYDKFGNLKELPLLDKFEVAQEILNYALKLYKNKKE